MTAAPLCIGLAGLGTVGIAVVQLIQEKANILAERTGRIAEIRAVSAKTQAKERGINISAYTWFDDPVALAQSNEIEVFIELIGGDSGPAEAAVRAALQAGKHVVTANKALLAKHGMEFARLAAEQGVSLHFEAAVAGGIPIVKTLREALNGNKISRVFGILNGTCNYILTKMEQEALSFQDCLVEAQRLGYAEADPTFDIGGHDTAHKLALLTSLAFGTEIAANDIYMEGITDVTLADIEAANELGYKIKLLGVAQRTESGIEQRVHPTMIPKSSAIARIDGVLNAVAVDADAVGQIMLVGPGAGGEATASAIFADIADVARGSQVAMLGKPTDLLDPYCRARMRRHEGGYYIHMCIRDQPGAFATIAARMAEHDISLESIVQRNHALSVIDKREGADEGRDAIIITYNTTEQAVRSALEVITLDGHVIGSPRMLRIERL